MISCEEYTLIASHLINLTSRIGTTIQSLLEDSSTSRDVSALGTCKSHMVTIKITLHLPVGNIILCHLKNPSLLKLESKLCTRSIKKHFPSAYPCFLDLCPQAVRLSKSVRQCNTYAFVNPSRGSEVQYWQGVYNCYSILENAGYNG